MDALARIGLIGDVHCEDQSLEKAIHFLIELKLDALFCTGDIPTGPGDINRSCDLLQQHRIATVRGNHDRWLLQGTGGGLPNATPPSTVDPSSWRFLESLRPTIEIQTIWGRAQLCHGLGEEDMLSVLPEQPVTELDEHPILCAWYRSQRYRLVFNGHSHRRMVRHHRGLTIVNAGTLRRDHQPCLAVVDFLREVVQFWDVLENGDISNVLECPLV